MNPYVQEQILGLTNQLSLLTGSYDRRRDEHHDHREVQEARPAAALPRDDMARTETQAAHLPQRSHTPLADLSRTAGEATRG